MRNLIIIFSVVLFLTNCTAPVEERNEKILNDIVKVEKDSFNLLCQYWDLDIADNPIGVDIAEKDNRGIEYQPGILFMTDSTVLENPKGKMTYGKFSLKDNQFIEVKYDDGRKANYEIVRLNEEELLLDRTEKKKVSNLFYKSSSTYWPDASKNPFSKQNYAWTKPPSKAEGEAGIRERAKECIRFYQYYFEGFANGGAKKINFDALPNCFQWYAGGIFIQKEDKLDNKFISCFYSTDEAFQARQILQEALTKKYDWDSTQTNWLKQTALVLQQVRDKM